MIGPAPLGPPGPAGALRLLVRAHRGDDGRAAPLGELHRAMPDGPGPAGHQNGLPLNRAVREDAAVGGHSGDAHARPLRVGHALRQADGLSGGQGDEFRRRPEGPVPLSVEDPDPLAGAGGIDARTHPIYLPGPVAVRDDAGEFHGASGAQPILGVGRIHARNGQADPHLARSRLRRGHLPDLDDFPGRTLFLVPSRPHQRSFILFRENGPRSGAATLPGNSR